MNKQKKADLALERFMADWIETLVDEIPRKEMYEALVQARSPRGLFGKKHFVMPAAINALEEMPYHWMWWHDALLARFSGMVHDAFDGPYDDTMTLGFVADRFQARMEAMGFETRKTADGVEVTVWETPPGWCKVTGKAIVLDEPRLASLVICDYVGDGQWATWIPAIESEPCVNAALSSAIDFYAHIKRTVFKGWTEKEKALYVEIGAPVYKGFNARL